MYSQAAQACCPESVFVLAESGYIHVKTPDIETAVEHAKGCPIYPSGGRVEVRPMLEI